MKRVGRIGSVLLVVVLTTVPAYAQLTEMKLLTPNGGESLVPGAVYEITWEGVKDNGDGVQLELSTDAGITWKNIAAPWIGLSYSWTVPQVESATCLIRVTHLVGSIGAPQSLGSLSDGRVEKMRNVDFSTDGERLIAVSDSMVSIWDVATRTLVRAISTRKLANETALSRDGRLIAVTPSKLDLIGMPPTVQIFDMNTGALYRTVVLHTAYDTMDIVNSVSFNADGSRLAVASHWYSTLWNVQSGELLDTLRSYSGGARVTALDYDGPGNRILLMDASGAVERDAVSMAAFGRVQGSFGLGHYGPEPELVTGGLDTVRVGDLATGSIIFKRSYTPGSSSKGVKSSRLNGRMVAHDDKSAPKVYHYLVGYAIAEIAGAGPVRWADMSPDGQIIVTVDKLGAVKLWSLPLRRDVSDAHFSIGNTLPVPLALDLGIRRGRRSSDTTITSFFRNTTSIPLQVTGITITGYHAGDFAITDGAPPLTIAPNQTAPLTLRITPPDTGMRSAALEIQTSAGNFTTRLDAHAQYGRITPLATETLIGDVVIGQSFVRGLDVFANTGNVPITLDTMLIKGEGAENLTVLEGGNFPFDLAAGATHRVVVRFTPTDTLPKDPGVTFRNEFGFFFGARFYARGVRTAAVGLEEPFGFDEALIVGITPQPARDELFVDVLLREAGDMSIDIRDMTGALLTTHSLSNVSAGASRQRIVTYDLPAGVYVATVHTGELQSSKSFVIVR